MMSTIQLELFQPVQMERPVKPEVPCEQSQYEHLYPYWREQMNRWVLQVFQYRHHIDTTGWSMARQGISFAHMLHAEGQLTLEEYRRYYSLHQRAYRWDLMRRRSA